MDSMTLAIFMVDQTVQKKQNWGAVTTVELCATGAPFIGYFSPVIGFYFSPEFHTDPGG